MQDASCTLLLPRRLAAASTLENGGRQLDVTTRHNEQLQLRDDGINPNTRPATATVQRSQHDATQDATYAKGRIRRPAEKNPPSWNPRRNAKGPRRCDNDDLLGFVWPCRPCPAACPHACFAACLLASWDLHPIPCHRLHDRVRVFLLQPPPLPCSSSPLLLLLSSNRVAARLRLRLLPLARVSSDPRHVTYNYPPRPSLSPPWAGLRRVLFF